MLMRDRGGSGRKYREKKRCEETVIKETKIKRIKIKTK